MRERAMSEGALLGRDLELKAVRDAYRDVLVSRSKRQLLIVADAGVGKRALVVEFLDCLVDQPKSFVGAPLGVTQDCSPLGHERDVEWIEVRGKL